ncbi:MAG: hypothetical protein RIC80_15270 [Cyclobacteriaceae bacterium]
MAKMSPFLGGNLKVVILSLVAATTFWFFNALNKNYDARINYPLEFEFARDSVVIVEELPDEVLIDVSSGGWNLLRKTFWFSVLPVVITLDNPADVKFLTRSSLIPIISDQILDLELNFLLTDTLFINVEHKVQKRVALNVDSLRIPLADNHRLVSPIRITPDTITVVGPASRISALPENLKIDIPRRNINSDFDRDVDVELPDGSLMTSQPEDVRIQFAVAEFTNVTLPVNLDQLNFPEDSSAYLEDSIIYVNYWVKADELNTVKPEDFVISADYTMIIRKDSTLLPILLESPTNAYDMEYFPDTLRISYAPGK